MDDNFVLKVLSGLQQGAEVRLQPGSYSIGNGEDDDIQLVDVSLRPGHLRLRLADGRIELAGESGAAVSRGGVELPVNGEFRELTPLDVITAGTTRFALGRPEAQWASVDALDQPSAAPADKPDPAAPTRFSRPLVIGLTALCLVLVVALSASLSARTQALPADVDVRPQAERLAAAFAALPFAQALTIRTEADGRAYVSGYVKTQAERRAVLEAIAKSAPGAYPRLQVLETLESDIGGWLDAGHYPLDHRLSPDGVLTLSGIVLDPKKAADLVVRIREEIPGLSGVKADIRTAKDFLADIAALARKVAIGPQVLFRLDGTLIEASGAVPLEKQDAWAGFLAAYSSRYADKIGLRSFVTLQDVVADTTTLQPVELGPGKPPFAGKDGAVVNPEFEARTLFAQPKREGEAMTTPSASLTETPLPVALATVTGRGAAIAPVEKNQVSTPVPPASSATAKPLAMEPSAPDLTAAARMLVSDRAPALARLAAARQAEPEELAADLDLLLAQHAANAGDQAPCRLRGQVKRKELAAVLVWLDLLSLPDGPDFNRFSRPEQAKLIEAALDPGAMRACLKALRARTPSTAENGIQSIYLQETENNPRFARYVLKSLPALPLQITGSSTADQRYIYTASGQRWTEGGAPDAANRIAVIGELGIATLNQSGYNIKYYDDMINFEIR